MNSTTVLLLVVVSLSMFATACAESTELMVDAGTGDGSTVTDSGTSTDAARVDMETPFLDAATDTDATLLTDAGESVDSSVAMDASVSSDAGSFVDSGIVPRDSSVLPPVDAGDPFGDAGSLGTPPWVPVTVLTSGSCEELEACGGDLIGTWDVTSACIAIPLGMITSLCSGAEITYAGGMARGRTTFDETTATRLAQSDVQVDMFVPEMCASFVGGCTGVESAVRMATPDAACVDDGDGNCNCSVRQISNIDNTDTYTTSEEGQITTGGGKVYDYCVTGDSSFSYTDVTPGSATSREPGIITLGAR